MATYDLTTATRKLARLQKRLRGVSGGTSAGKTISILQLLIDYCQTTKGDLVSVVSESFPHLKRGAMRDFEYIMQGHGYWKDSLWNATNFIYSFETGSKLEFFSADQPSKVRGPRRDVLFINEANNVPYETYDQLAIRTKKTIWLDWNPTHEFWWYTDVAPHAEHDFETLTYLDNESLDPAIIADIESHKHNKNWWLVYGLGQLGEIESRIFTGWVILDEIPHEAKLIRRGLDFGYTNDPTAIVDIYSYNGGFILDERLYRKRMSNQDIANYLNNCEDPNTLIFADSSEPKSIDEIASYGVPILGTQKGQGSVLQGIQYVQDQRISMTKRSVNLIKEYRNYLWETDKEGRIINQPIDLQNHCMDAIRYGLETYTYAKNIDRAGVVTLGGIDNRAKSFIVSTDGTTGPTYNLEDAIRQQSADNRSWQYR